MTLSNPTTAAINLSGWKLKDKANNEFAFTGTIPAQSSLTVTMTRSAMLNNTGDEVWLVSPSSRAESPEHATASVRG